MRQKFPADVVLMLGQRLRRSSSINTALAECMKCEFLSTLTRVFSYLNSIGEPKLISCTSSSRGRISLSSVTCIPPRAYPRLRFQATKNGLSPEGSGFTFTPRLSPPITRFSSKKVTDKNADFQIWMDLLILYKNSNGNTTTFKSAYFSQI